MQQRDMKGGISSITACLSPPQISSLQDHHLQNNNNINLQIQSQNQNQNQGHSSTSSTSSRFEQMQRLNVNPNDFLDQILSNIPSWNDNPTSPWELHANQNLANSVDDSAPYDDSTMLASRLRQHQISSSSSPHQQNPQLGLFGLPLSLGNNGDSSNGDGSAMFNGLTGSLQQQHFHHNPQSAGSNPTFGLPTPGMNQGPTVGTNGSNPVKQKVRARRGQATDPHSIAERLRRERIADRMKALQELVPNANKTDKASMLDEIIDYVKFLQLQVKVLSMSRLGGAAAVPPLVAGTSSEGNVGAKGRPGPSNDSITVTENKVAELMEGGEMGQAMQYLQGKGLCLMPITLAKAIQSTTCHSRNLHHNNNPLLSAPNLDGPSSPSLSVLTVQSATMGNGEPSVKDATSVTKP